MHRCPPEELLHETPLAFEVQLHLDRCGACRALLDQTSPPETLDSGHPIRETHAEKGSTNVEQPPLPPLARGDLRTLRRPENIHWAEPDFTVLVLDLRTDAMGNESALLQALVEEFTPGTSVIVAQGLAVVPVSGWCLSRHVLFPIGHLDERLVQAIEAGETIEGLIPIEDLIPIPEDAPSENDESLEESTACDALKQAFLSRLVALDDSVPLPA
jgi:hypothetical protein